MRHYGDVQLHRADTVEDAQAMLARMIALHEATWQARGKPGAFATPYLRRFHTELVARALPRGKVDLLEFRAADETIGILCNFRLRGRVSAYQSGFAPVAGNHARPGLTCHMRAIAESLARGDAVHDFLGGADRYRRSLAKQEVTLAWAELVPGWSPAGMALRGWNGIALRGWHKLRPHAAPFRSTSIGRNAEAGGEAA